MIETLNYIGGKWAPSESGRTGTRENPACISEVVARFQLSTPDVPEALGEMDRSLANMYFTAGQGTRLYGRGIPSASGDTLIFTQRVPLGVTAIITPWNFPFAIPAWKTSHALVCGNTLVFKPSSLTPLCAQLLVQCYEQAGIPAGAINLVTGSGDSVGAALASDERVKGISFTGSNAVGRWLYAEAAKHLCHVPFGGLKASGLGEKECGPAAMDFFSEEQIVYVRA